MEPARSDAGAQATAFAQAFGTPPQRRYRAPGRINLIGEHTDYNQGWVMPGAIDLDAWVAMAPRPDRRMRLGSAIYSDIVEFDLDAIPPPAQHRHWAQALVGVAVLLERAGQRLRGADCWIESQVPVGAGLSSSAAVEVACGLAWSMEAGAAVDRTALAQLCQQASHEFGGTRCGIMDLYIACHGRAGHLLQLDTRSLEAQWLAWPAGAVLAVCDTGVRHDNAANAYNQRRRECEAAVRRLAAAWPGLASLREVAAADLPRAEPLLPAPLAARVRHVVSENARVLAAAAALRARDFVALGQLLQESHRSLRDDYEVSCAELDAMAELCGGQEGVYGARMMGGGFGGCVLALVQPQRLERFRERVAGGYHRATGREARIWACQLAAGASPEEAHGG